MSKPDTIPALSADQVVEILNKTLEQLNQPEACKKLDDAKTNVGNEMLKMMQFLFPIVMQVQIDVIKNHGFPESREGIIMFSQIVRNFERENEEVSRLHSLIKAYYLPLLSVPANNEGTEE